MSKKVIYKLIRKHLEKPTEQTAKIAKALRTGERHYNTMIRLYG